MYTVPTKKLNPLFPSMLISYIFRISVKEALLNKIRHVKIEMINISKNYCYCTIPIEDVIRIEKKRITFFQSYFIWHLCIYEIFCTIVWYKISLRVSYLLKKIHISNGYKNTLSIILCSKQTLFIHSHTDLKCVFSLTCMTP